MEKNLTHAHGHASRPSQWYTNNPTVNNNQLLPDLVSGVALGLPPPS